MSISQVIIKQGSKVLDHKPTHSGYIVDEQGKEVQITTAMVRSVCHQLLNRCRTIKN
ncbi:PA1571 family protein [Acinetobacter sp. ANC 4470]|uniref:PA1571 family protein n=1 Tax=Acinetobacter sp. ANC 4470 TaxID=1977881 RepID=UPI000A34D0F0|nr:PA1571 family protein [Acinetobacter sp. ANC 4470]